MSDPTPGRALKARGFTLTELVAVLMLVGIVAVVLLPRSNNDAIAVTSQAEQVAADMRYVQSLAMTQGQRYRIDLGATSYQLLDGSNNPVAHPFTGQTGAIGLAAGVSLSPAARLEFDGMGQPYTVVGVVVTAFPGPGPSNFTLTLNGNTSNLSVFPQTGMARVF